MFPLDASDMLSNPDLLKGTALQIATIIGLVGVASKFIKDNAARDMWLPLAALIAGVIVVVLPAYIIDPRIELWYRGIVLGGAATGLYGVSKDAIGKVINMFLMARPQSIELKTKEPIEVETKNV